MIIAIALVLGAVLGYGACYLDLTAWLLACWASLLGAQWYSPRQHCPPCGRQVHLLRYHADREGTFGPGDDGKRCVGCSHRTPRTPGIAPERAESADAGLSVLGWPGVPGSAQGHAEPSAIQDRTNERK